MIRQCLVYVGHNDIVRGGQLTGQDVIGKASIRNMVSACPEAATGCKGSVYDASIVRTRKGSLCSQQ